jgi:hypothetical protein
MNVFPLLFILSLEEYAVACSVVGLALVLEYPALTPC